MAESPYEVLRSVPDRRRKEGQRFQLAAVLLYAILGMAAGAIRIDNFMNSFVFIAYD